jgi:hypothetical protein
MRYYLHMILTCKTNTPSNSSILCLREFKLVVMALSCLENKPATTLRAGGEMAGGSVLDVRWSWAHLSDISPSVNLLQVPHQSNNRTTGPGLLVRGVGQHSRLADVEGLVQGLR